MGPQAYLTSSLNLHDVSSLPFQIDLCTGKPRSRSFSINHLDHGSGVTSGLNKDFWCLFHFCGAAGLPSIWHPKQT